MKRYESMCVDCTSRGMHCLGPACRLRRVEVHYCDRCGCEITDIDETKDEELCDDCSDDCSEENE